MPAVLSFSHYRACRVRGLSAAERGRRGFGAGMAGVLSEISGPIGRLRLCLFLALGPTIAFDGGGGRISSTK